MRTTSLLLGLTLLMGCSKNDTDTDTDDTDIDDTGIDDTCGDGVLDPDEECDDGEENAADGSCSPECTWVDFLSCDDLDVEIRVAQPEADGTLQVYGRFTENPALVTACDDPPMAQAVVQATLPSTGMWLITTDTPGTDARTAISVRTECDERVELSCTDPNTARPGPASVIVDTETTELTVVVEQLEGGGGGWHLSFKPISEQVAVGEVCDTDNICPFDATCTDGLCVTAAAPTISSVEILAERNGLWTHVVTGSDPNRDVTDLRIVRSENTFGNIYGDDPSEGPLLQSDATLTWDGDTYTFVLEQSQYTPDWAEWLSVDFEVVDATERSATANTASYPTRPMTSSAGDGEACDLDGYPVGCGWPLICTVQPDDSGACGANLPPTLTSATFRWSGGVPSVWVEGSDLNQVLGQSPLTATFSDGTEATVYASPQDVSWDAGDFVARFDMLFWKDSPPSTVAVVVSDGSESSDPTTVTWTTEPARTEVAADGECDLSGETTTCAGDTVCSPALGGPPTCQPAEAPTLHSATGTAVFDSNNFAWNYVFTVVADDPNADFAGSILTTTTPTGRVTYTAPVDPEFFGTPWTPLPSSESPFYQGTVVVPGGFEPAALVQLSLVDSAGATSEPMFVSVGDVLSTGETCDPTSTGVICDPTDGLTCGAASSCEPGVAPTVGEVTVRRLDSTTVEIIVHGADANADALDLRVDLTTAAGTQTLESVLPATSMLGSTDFEGVFEVELDSFYLDTPIDPLVDVDLTLVVRDLLGLESASSTHGVPPILSEGDTCSDDPTIDQCYEGTACVASLCVPAPPVLTDMTITMVGNGRDGIATITGSDLTKDLASFRIELGTEVYEESNIGYVGDYGVENTIVWDGGSGFTLEVQLDSIGAGALIDVVEATVLVTDATGLQDQLVASVPPQRTVFDTCDINEVDDLCHAGLFCDAGSCAVDSTDPCAGIPVLEFADLKESTTNGWVVPYDTATGTSLHTMACDGGWTTTGGNELVVRYVADATGTLTVGTEVTTGNGYLFARWDECVAELSLAGCSTNGSYVGPNSLTLDVVAGDVLFFTVDEGYGSGSGDLRFVLE